MLRPINRNSKTRPHFGKISPMVYASAWCFAVINIFFLAPAFFFGNGAKGLSLVGLVPSNTWGMLHIFMGCNMMFALYTNSWSWIKYMLIFGLLVKSMFAWALTATLFISIANIGIVGIWFGLMAWQSLCIIYFTPLLWEKNNGSNK